MNHLIRLVLIAVAMHGSSSQARATETPLGDYLYPKALPPAVPARFVYDGYGYRSGSGSVRTNDNPYSTKGRDHIVDNTTTSGQGRQAGLGSSYFSAQAPSIGYFSNGANGSGSSSFGYFDCFFPQLPLFDVKPAGYPSTFTLSLNSQFECLASLLPSGPKYAFAARYYAPAVVSVDNGNLIEVVKVEVRRDGLAWADYQFGYHLGPIRFDAAETTKTFFSVPQLAATSLPPPAVEGTVVEYRNTQDFPQAPGGHFFYSSDPDEQAGVDAGQAGKFERTGRSFNAGGYVPVCRFYGSVRPGPNSHFFSATPDECAQLKSLQQTPPPSGLPQWNSEGNSFYTVAPLSDAQGQKTCLAGTQPVYRAYNNAFAANGQRNAWDSNHRFSTARSDIDPLVQSYGWRDEGIAFCTPLAAF